MMSFDLLVVGAGLSGATIAEQAARAGKRVLVIDQRDHLAGNCYDYLNEHQQRISSYGAHIFHTNSEKVWQYLSQFTAWLPYEHQVKALVKGQLYSLPINLQTLNQFFALNLETAEQMKSFLAKKGRQQKDQSSLEHYLLAQIGPELYQNFFAGYSQKQWSLPLTDLSAAIVKRLPLRFSADERYFTDRFQGLPKNGFSTLVKKMLSSPLIELRLKTDYFAAKDKLGQFKQVFYTGPVDQYFEHCFGPLEYRSLVFEAEEYLLAAGQEFQQANSVINYPDPSLPYTRSVEYKYLYPPKRTSRWTTVIKEFPTWTGEPYYPVPRPENELLAKRYQELVKKEAKQGIYFLGRLGTYRYINMDQAVAEALQLWQRLAKK